MRLWVIVPLQHLSSRQSHFARQFRSRTQKRERRGQLNDVTTSIEKPSFTFLD